MRQLNAMDIPELRTVLADFCAAPSWIDGMVAARSFGSPEAVLTAADSAARSVPAEDWREAFRHHPRIGERAAEKPQSDVARALSSQEQAGVSAAASTDLAALAEGNRAYEARFGHVFIISAAGRSAAEMLANLRDRLKNDPAAEIDVAATEQRKITRLRLERLLGS
jgi:OHCU decarboxylase